MSYIIRTIPNSTLRTLYYNSCGAPEWQPWFPEIFSSKERATKTLEELQKTWKGIEVSQLASIPIE